MSKSKNVYSNNLGRAFYIKHILETILIKLLSKLSIKHIKNNEPQLAIFSFDGIGTTINVKGIYERVQLDSLLGWLQSNKLIKGSALDIGANIGNHSLYFSKFYKYVFSFEPNPRTFKLLEINSTLSPNIVPFNYGLSDTSGKVSMGFCKENMGGAKIINSIDSISDLNEIEIEIRTLDSMLDQLAAPIGLIKLDVEGHEYAAILGAKNAINTNKPIILFEQNIGDFKDGVSDVIELLKTMGYSSFGTLMPSPFLTQGLPQFLRPLITLGSRLIFGFEYKIVFDKNITPRFYSFIIAVPD